MLKLEHVNCHCFCTIAKEQWQSVEQAMKDACLDSKVWKVVEEY